MEMSKSEQLANRKSIIDKNLDLAINNMEQGAQEAKRTVNIVRSTDTILDNLDEEFQIRTGLTKNDVAFLFVATGLQVARQYLLTQFEERLSDKEAASKVYKDEKHSNRHHRYYNPSLEEILTNPAPFDAIEGSQGALVGGGKLGHRTTAIGHDCVLGLVFGTSNIATSTLTNNKMQTFHIATGPNKRDAFVANAKTDLMFQHVWSKMAEEGATGKEKIGASIIAEVKHLHSDLYTKHSLAIPVISTIDPKLASYLAEKGFDMANIVDVGKQASYAMLINSIISMAHGVLYDGDGVMDRKLYDVRTRKILTLSNVIASASNLGIVYATEDLKKLDLGGLAVSIYQTITDVKKIREIKRDFIFGEYEKMIMDLQ